MSSGNGLEEVKNGVTIQPEEVLGECGDGSKLRISIVVNDEPLAEVEVDAGTAEIVVEELA